MPLYEYHCKDCDGVFEKLVSFSEADRNPACPECQGQHTERKISKIASMGTPASSAGGVTASNCSSQGRFS